MITQKRLKELLTYDPETGIFTHNLNRCSVKRGQLAGYVRHEQSSDLHYVSITLDGKRYMAHRLAFLCVHGYIPEVIDHKDGDGMNNMITNLRAATHIQNAQNQRISSLNTSGYKGVCYDKERKLYRVRITVCGRRHHLGRFKTAAEAHEAYKKAATHYFGEFARFE